MKIISGTDQFHIEEKTAIALGKFDGVHLGHQKLLQCILEQKKAGLSSVVFTFDPAPMEFLTGKPMQELTTKAEKRLLFEKMGIDYLIEFPMNAKTASTPPDLFIKDYLIEQLHMAFVAAGDDMSFGDKGKGNCDLLRAYSETYHYQVEIIEKVHYEGVEVGSTYVRQLVEKGDVALAGKLLQSNYCFSGTVIPGKQLGRTMGMPTVNVKPEAKKLLPAFGVYYSRVVVDDVVYNAITNIGYKPTVDDTKTPIVESYLYDFSGDLYGKDIIVELLAYKRPEMKFADVDALKTQMQEDIAAGEAFHRTSRA